MQEVAQTLRTHVGLAQGTTALETVELLLTIGGD